MVDERLKRPAFGALLRSRRLAAGLTQDLLAARARISVQAVSALERGARFAPRGETLSLLTAALQLEGAALGEFEAAARASVKRKIRASQPLFRAASRKRADLPQFGTSFLGRDREARELAAAIAGGGCTTLWGAGGVGKTRLAIETSALVEDRFESIAFVGLATAIGDDAVDDAIAAAFGVVRAPGDDLLGRVAIELAKCSRLVIVDNCEHVIAGAARSVGALAAASPGTAFVCTSREPLRIAGERVLEVDPLNAQDARRLFVDRAAPADGDSPSATDARDIATICRRLDGIPLALELAAACARVLDLKHVASGLDGRFRLLTRGSRGASDRHATLRATIAWSYELLEPSERHVFQNAAVINGAFSLDDLVAIGVDDGFDHASVLAATAALVEKSLIVVDVDTKGAPRRYRLLESTRAFALEVAETPESGAVLVESYRRWGRYVSDQLRRSIEAYRNEEASIGDDHLDHVRGYLDWAIDKRHDVAAGTMLAGDVHLVWDLCGLHGEGIRRIEAGLAFLDADAHARAAMIGWYAVSRLNQRLVRTAESLAPGLRAYELAARVGDDGIRANSALKVAFAYDFMGEHEEALAYAREAVAVFERRGDRLDAAVAANTAALIAFKIRPDTTALENVRGAVDRVRSLGDLRRTASAQTYLGETYFAFGNVEAAIATAHLALAQFRKTASRYELAIGLTNLGAYLSAAGRAFEAAPFAREALEIGRDGRYTRFVALAAQTCATIAAVAGREKRRCVQLLGFVARRYETIGEIGYTERSAHGTLRSASSSLLSATLFTEAIREGEAFDDERAIDAALQCIAGVSERIGTAPLHV